MNIRRRAIASVLAVMMVVSLVFASAASVRADSVEVRYEESGMEISGKIYADLSNLMFAVIGSMGSDGETLADAGVYIDSHAIAISSTPFLPQAYGVDFSKLLDNLPKSILAPNSGSSFALDQETFDMILNAIKNPTSAVKTPAIDTAVIEKLAGVLMTHIGVFADALMENAEYGMAPGTLTTDLGDVAVSNVTITVRAEALGTATVALINDIAQNQETKAAAAEIYDALLASGTVTAPEGLEGISGADLMEAVWPQLPELANSVVEELKSEDAFVSVTASSDKETEELVALAVTMTINNESVVIEGICVDNLFSLHLSAPGTDPVALTAAIAENSSTAFSAYFACTEGSREVARFGVDYAPVSGAYTLSVASEGSSAAMSGTITSSGDTTVITVEDIDGNPINGFSITLRSNDTIAMPAYQELLTMSEADLMELVQTISETVQSLTGAFAA